MIKDDELFDKYNGIWEIVAASASVSEPAYKKNYVKAKIKSYNGKINTNIHNN